MNDTMKFAEAELDRYCKLIMGNQYHAIKCELLEDSETEKIIIDIHCGEGKIGANRSGNVLIGVYCFLQKLGVRFLRPGKTGEVIPHVEKDKWNFKNEIVPSVKYRGMVIEGAVSIENVLEFIDWSNKVGFNCYFIQFRKSYEFFERWYEHIGNEHLEKEPFNDEIASKYLLEILAELKKRDMIYHAVGHGWTCECLGVPSTGWQVRENDLCKEDNALLALVSEKRDYFGGIPLNTHLCYSNPIVQQKMVDEIVAYAKKHGEVEVLHFWLADNFNNICECDDCQKKTFSDWYVMILNKLDKALEKEKLKTKICFIAFYETFWAPKEEQIENKDRFVLLVAPIFRNYNKSYSEVKRSNATPKFVLNKNKFSSQTGDYLAFFDSWRESFSQDTILFDYHLMWDIYRDFSGNVLAKTIAKDVDYLSNMKINGFLSCQQQRCYFPNGLPVYMLSKKLFDSSLTYAQIESEYYSSAFAQHGNLAQEVYKYIEDNVDYQFFRCDINQAERIQADLFIDTITQLNEYKKLVAACEGENDIENESLAILKFLLEFLAKYLYLIAMRIQKLPSSELYTHYNLFKKWFDMQELRFQPYFDMFFCDLIIKGFLDLGSEEKNFKEKESQVKK